MGNFDRITSRCSQGPVTSDTIRAWARLGPSNVDRPSEGVYMPTLQDSTHADEVPEETVPYLFAEREYVAPVAGTTTVSAVTITSPVKESGPDD